MSRTASVVLLQRRAARHARSAHSTRVLLACLWRTVHIFRVLQENFVRFVRMAGVIANELEEERNLELPGSPAWLLVRNRKLAARKPRALACFVLSMLYVKLPPLCLWRSVVG